MKWSLNRLAILFRIFLLPLLILSVPWASAYPGMTSHDDPVPEQEMTSYSQDETPSKSSKPVHVYRPRAPVFGSDHPENQPKPLEKKRYPLVTHPELKSEDGSYQ